MRIATSQMFQAGINNIQAQQNKVLKLQTELSSNVRVAVPSDDPVASAQITMVNQRISSIQQYQNNNQTVSGALSVEEGVLNGVVDSIQTLQQIQIKAGNPTLSSSDRLALAQQAKDILGQLQGFANAKDADGNFLFSGSKSNTPAISVSYDSSTNSNVYNYDGDSTQRFQAISDSLQVPINDTGDNVFMKIPAGNGSFAVLQPSTPNTGTAYVSTSSVANSGSYVPGTYTMNFAAGSGGGIDVNVVDGSGTTVYTAPYASGSSINFNGMQLTINGEPAAGDSFTIQSGQNNSLFATVQQMITSLSSPLDTGAQKAVMATQNNQLIGQLSSALTNISNIRSNLGSRQNQLTAMDTNNQNLLLVSQTTLKQLQEIDPVSVAADYNQQLVSLQAAQQSFVRIQNLSVFNYM